MISVEKICKKDIKYCTNCDERAKFKINVDNPKVIQHSPVACLCELCMIILKECLKLKE